MKKIDFEAHFFTHEYLQALTHNEGFPRITWGKDEKGRELHYCKDVRQPFSDSLLTSLLNLGEERLRIMDAHGIDIQILSLSAPGLEQFSPEIGTHLATAANSELAEAIERYPDRFMGFAALAPNAPEAAADELERAVKELGFVGWNTHSNYGDSYLDNEKYHVILERAEMLHVPIYLHPTVPAISQVRSYGFALAGAPFGFGMETAMAMMRLIMGGVFDKFPGLRIILGHLGETLPFLLKRMDWAYVRPFDPSLRPSLSKRPSEYFKTNVFVTTSGNYYEPAFMCTRQAMGIDRVLLGLDYPYEDSKEGMDFLKSLPIPEKEKERIYGGNARQLGFSF